MISMRQANGIRSIRLAAAVSLAMAEAVAAGRYASGPPDGRGRDRAPDASGQWVPDVQKEWERHGAKLFQPVPADQAHGTFVFRDLADRSGVGAFEIWVLVDGQRVKDWTASSPLRVLPGA